METNNSFVRSASARLLCVSLAIGLIGSSAAAFIAPTMATGVMALSLLFATGFSVMSLFLVANDHVLPAVVAVIVLPTIVLGYVYVLAGLVEQRSPVAAVAMITGLAFLAFGARPARATARHLAPAHA